MGSYASDHGVVVYCDNGDRQAHNGVPITCSSRAEKFGPGISMTEAFRRCAEKGWDVNRPAIRCPAHVAEYQKFRDDFLASAVARRDAAGVRDYLVEVLRNRGYSRDWYEGSAEVRYDERNDCFTVEPDEKGGLLRTFWVTINVEEIG